MAMSNPFQQYQQVYGYDDDLELKRQCRSREEYEYRKNQRMQEEMYRLQSMMSPPPVVMPAPQPQSHLNKKLLLTKGA